MMAQPDSATNPMTTPLRLLSIPSEIIEQIVMKIVRDLGFVRETVALRLTCRTFDSYLMECFLKDASQLNFLSIFNHESYKQLYQLHGSEILRNKALRDDVTDNEPVIKFVQRLVGYMSQQPGLSTGERDEQRARDTLVICNAMKALNPINLNRHLIGKTHATSLHFWGKEELSPALAAATGDIDTLQQTITLAHLEPQGCELFPNALDAAIATSQDHALQLILAFISTNTTKGTCAKCSWSGFRRVARQVGNALKVALRLHNAAAVTTILSFLAGNTGYRRSMPKDMGKQLIQTCVEYRNIDGLVAVLEYGRGEAGAAYEMSSRHVRALFGYCRKETLQRLIDDELLDPTPELTWDEPTTLGVALDTGRLDLAKVLIENGADLDTPLWIDDHTPLFSAVLNDDYMQVKRLLVLGAVPGHPKDVRSPWGYAVRSNAWQCLFLIEAAVKCGVAFLERSDIWEHYYRWSRLAIPSTLDEFQASASS